MYLVHFYPSTFANKATALLSKLHVKYQKRFGSRQELKFNITSKQKIYLKKKNLKPTQF